MTPLERIHSSTSLDIAQQKFENILPEELSPFQTSQEKKWEELQNLGFKLPERVQSFLEAAKKILFFIDENIVPNFVRASGLFFKYLGLAFLIAGTLHAAILLFTTPLTLSLMPFFIELVSSGALPLAAGGLALYALGKDMRKEQFGALYYLLLALPFTSYFSKFFPLPKSA